MYFVYVIKSLKYDWNYVGITNDIQRRIQQHNAGQNKSTKHYKPFKLIFSEEFPDRITARKREKYLKSAAGRRWMKSILF
jgi:putative endonuclease